MTLLLVLLALTWSGLAGWTYLEHRVCARCDRQLTSTVDRGHARGPSDERGDHVEPIAHADRIAHPDR